MACNYLGSFPKGIALDVGNMLENCGLRRSIRSYLCAKQTAQISKHIEDEQYISQEESLPVSS